MPTGALPKIDPFRRAPVHRDEPAFRFPLRRSRTLIAAAVAVLFLIYYYTTLPNRPSRAHGDIVDWKKFAYSQYATNSAHVCNAVMVFEALERLGSKADRVLLYPEEWDTVISNSKDRDSQLLVMARDKYRVKLHPIKMLSVDSNSKDPLAEESWDHSITKLLAFGLTYYDRILHLDGDITLLQHLDELFLLPSTPVAMPRAYWYETKPWPLTSLLVLFEPNVEELRRFQAAASEHKKAGLASNKKYDMDLLNERFAESAMVLPHRPYSLLTGEFRAHKHHTYLGNNFEKWDPDAALKEAKLVHFSDWPLPKPWIMWPSAGLAEMQPDCGGKKEGTCRERVIWKDLYDDFRLRRKDICRLLSVPAPEWTLLKAAKDKAENSTA